MLKGKFREPVHFIGVGGSGMAPLAEMSLAQGLTVQGSDLKSSPTTERLIGNGAHITIGHQSRAAANAGTVVYSSAIGQDNPELEAAKLQGSTILHRSDYLAALLADSKAITVAGTHGKSTTSAMITHMLDDLGCKPKAVIGAEMRRYESSLLDGDGEYFVAEADESDGSFLKYRPFVGIITNIELDHLDYFKSDEALLSAFSTYLTNINPDGVAVVGWDHPLSRTVGHSYAGNRLTYGFVLGCDVRARDYACRDGLTTFKAMVERDSVNVSLPTMGKHNVQNALCALAVARALDLDVGLAAQSLASFKGVKRRMDRIFADANVIVFDDYAHNPGKIAACVQALRQTWPDRKLHVVYQAHRFSRLETMYLEMLQSLDGADVVYVLPVYSAGETTTRDFSPGKLSDDLRVRVGLEAVPCGNHDDAVSFIKKSLREPAIVLTVGAGDVWQVAEKLKDSLA